MALTIDGSDPTGDLGDLLASKLNIAGGKILQIVRATDGTNRSTTSATFVDVTGMAVTITPQKSDSAIIIVAIFRSITPGITYGQFAITDNSNNAISGAESATSGVNTGVELNIMQTLFARDTPATTSATTYKLRFRSDGGGTIFCGNGGNTGQLYAIEVSA